MTELSQKTDASKGAGGMIAQFGQAAVDDVIAQFNHVTGHGVTKEARIENKVRNILSLKII